jgi:hypothetical protein
VALVAPKPTAALPERGALRLQLQVARKRKALSASSEIREGKTSVQTGHRGIDDACARAKELKVYQIQVLKKKRERSWRDLLSSS